MEIWYKRLKKKVAEKRGGEQRRDGMPVRQACRHVGRFTWRGQPALLETLGTNTGFMILHKLSVIS